MKLGLLGRISLALLVVGLLPLAIVSFRLLRLNRDAMAEQVLRTHAVAAGTTAGRIESFLASRRYVAEVAAGSAALAADPRSAAATDLLSELLRSELGVAAVAVRDPAGEEVVRVQRREHAAAAAAVLAAPGSDELTVWRGQASSGPASWLRLELPLAGGGGRLLVVFDLAPLATALRPAELGEQAKMVVADRDGTLVEGGPIGAETAALAGFPQQMLTAALTGRVSGSGRYAAAGEAVLGAYAPVGGAPWIVLSRQPARVAESTAITMRRRALVSLVVAVALALLMTGVARQTIVRPLRSLIAAQRELAGVSGEAPAAGNEIEQLRATFTELARRLREREELGEVFLGRYRVKAVVGEGAMGTVFEAWDPALERAVAIKTVRLDRWAASERAELASRLRDEAVTVARFSHPNIVGLYDIQDSPEVAFLAMEYVDGASLERYLQACGRLPAVAAIAIGQGITRGLAAAHARGVVHHDVKPANVLLGRDGAIKVVDFGISQVIASLSADASTLLGTPGFIPPESLAGQGFSPRGDLFALGVTLYRMTTGRMPFSGQSVAEVLGNTVTGVVTPPAALVPELPAGLGSLIASLLEKDPAARCPSADEALRRLDDLAAELGASWQPPPSFGTTDRLEHEATTRLRGSQRLPAPTAAAGRTPTSWLGGTATMVMQP